MTWKSILKNSAAIVILETDEIESSPNFDSERDRAVKMAQEKVNELGKKHYFYYHRTDTMMGRRIPVKKFKILESNIQNNGWIRLNQQNDLSGLQLLEPQK